MVDTENLTTISHQARTAPAMVVLTALQGSLLLGAFLVDNAIACSAIRARKCILAFSEGP